MLKKLIGYSGCDLVDLQENPPDLRIRTGRATGAHLAQDVVTGSCRNEWPRVVAVVGHARMVGAIDIPARSVLARPGITS